MGITTIYGFDIGKKKFEGLLELFFVCNCKRFKIVQTVRIHLPKIFIFFFHMLFGAAVLGGLPSRVLAGTK